MLPYQTQIKPKFITFNSQHEESDKNYLFKKAGMITLSMFIYFDYFRLFLSSDSIFVIWVLYTYIQISKILNLL